MPTNFQTGIQLVLTAATTGTPQKEAILTVGPTPEYLVTQGGFPQLDLVITAAVIDKVHFDHGITKGLLERLDAILNAPKALYKSHTTVQGAVVVTLEVKGGGPVVVALHPDKQMGRDRRCNVIASLYAKEADIESKWQKKGLLVWTPPVAPPVLAIPVVQAEGPVKEPGK